MRGFTRNPRRGRHYSQWADSSNSSKSYGRPVVRIFAGRRGAEWIFSVEDNGIGIDPRHTSRIFRIFERLHGIEMYPGTGVGLAVAQQIVERHGAGSGSIRNPAMARRFRLRFPPSRPIAAPFRG
jgi:light-regulated signal transduction histidine kinase (bacteriophytochrome)